MFRKNTIFIKKCGDLDSLKNAIYKFTRNWVLQNNSSKELIDKLSEELEIGEVRNLTGGIYPDLISLAKSDYELLLKEENPVIENNKILGMEVKLRHE